MINKAVILAGGKGTRFYPYSKSIPKEMLPIVDKPAIELIIDEVVNSGIRDICVVSAKNKKVLNDFITNLKCLANITLLFQETPNGTGGATLVAKNFTNNQPFALLNGDDLVFSQKIPAIKQLIDYFDVVKNTVIGVQKVPEGDIHKYSSVEINHECINTHCPKQERGNLIKEIHEKPSPPFPSLFSALGRHVLTNEIFDEIEYHTTLTANGELPITDAINNLAKRNRCYMFEFYGTRYDLGSKFGYMQAITEYALRHNEINDKYLAYLKSLRI